MANLNRVFLIGNLTRDPELRYTPQGTAVVNLRLAINHRFRNKNGEEKNETCFITVVVWNKHAETCNQYLRKGRAVFIEGRLQSRDFEDASGQRRSVIEVRADRVQFLGSPLAGASEGTAAHNNVTNNIEETTTEQTWLEEEGEVHDEQ